MHKRGFTLVELSIVLVILGLLIGGVLTGQSLIRASELRSLSSQYQRYIASVMTFRDKYMALPGDMTNATAYWNAANATPATCVTTASTSALTCNGDGDGRIVPSAGSNEYFRFWQHMANAGLIEGNYSGIAVGSSAYGASTANAPTGKVDSGLWMSINLGVIGSSDPYMFAGNYNNSFEYGLRVPNYDPSASLIKPEDLYNIDTKLDDGKPGTGFLVVRDNTNLTSCTNATGQTNYTATYLLTNQTKACAIIFRQQF